MQKFSLTDRQKQSLEKDSEDFKKWIKTLDGIKTIEGHRTQSYFKQKLSLERLDVISEQEFIEVYKKLYASNM